MDQNTTLERSLTLQQMTTAAMVGVRRQISAMAYKRKSFVQNATTDYPFENHIMGCMAELVISELFNLHWNDGVGKIDGCDVGGLVEVRGRRPRNGVLDLGFQPDRDKLHKPFVLVRCEPPKFFVIGWIWGFDGMKIAECNEATGVYYVRGAVPPLRPISELMASLNIDLAG